MPRVVRRPPRQGHRDRPGHLRFAPVTRRPERGFGSDGLVPVIDIGGWRAGDAASRAATAAAVDAAGRTVGFMQIVGHGIPGHTVAGLAAALDAFFGLPVDVKNHYRSPRPAINRGYSPPRSERLSYSLGV